MVMGILGQLPFAGVAWQVLHYLEGLRRLGHDVYYVEDTGAWPYDPEQNTITDDPRYPVTHIGRLMERVGMGQRWAYCIPAADRSVCGPLAQELNGLFGTDDALINVTGSTRMRVEHLAVPARIYVETDPVGPQIQRAQGWQAAVELLDAHTSHFTFGENVGTPRCPLPTGRIAYRPTRQPVVLDWWSGPAVPPSLPRRFTTVASWRGAFGRVEYAGQTYGL